VVQVKICGITNLADARSAVAAGADILGFNFYRPSPRFIDPAAARIIIRTLRSENSGPIMVGVFVNEEPPESIATLVAECDLNGVQLHGDESPEFCQKLKNILNGRMIIKAFRVAPGFNPKSVNDYDVDAIMLDAFHTEIRGGTGQVIDWNLAEQIGQKAPRLFLAGGLAPENVAAAISQTHPYAVDACSSLESSPGQKDAARMRAFVQAVRNS
jgi:phosphoribosylanthranilate isomerase